MNAEFVVEKIIIFLFLTCLIKTSLIFSFPTTHPKRTSLTSAGKPQFPASLFN